VMLDRLEGGESEGLADAGHDIAVGHAVDALDVLAAKESGEEDLVPDAHAGGELDHAEGHVPGAGDDELDVVHLFEDSLGGGDEVLGALLHGDAPQEEDDAVLGLDLRTGGGLLDLLLNAVVDDIDLVGVDSVAPDAD